MTEPAAKATLRRLLRQQRQSIPHLHRRAAARAVARKALRWRVLRDARRIGLYLAMGSELSTLALIQLLHRAGKALYLPVVVRGRMVFRRWHPRIACRRHRLGMSQPVGGARLPTRRLDVILLPLLGFDTQGTRLGQGGGYYDRALARHAPHPLRIGLAYARQQVDHLPRDPWDVPLHAILTEHGLRRFHRAARGPTDRFTGRP